MEYENGPCRRPALREHGGRENASLDDRKR
jgi:hypothetical protein